MQDLPSLNVCRALTGLGSALALPASAGLIGAMYPAGRARSLAFTAVSCGASAHVQISTLPPSLTCVGGAIGGTGGDVLAGLMIQYTPWTWRGPFLVLSVLNLYPLAICYFLVPPDPKLTTIDLRMDWIGAFVLGSAIFFVLFGLTIAQTSPNGWQTNCA